ncbi:MAG: HupE/UreJ family protein [Planctomycetaceae bacterium]|nr:HupE/UreJ family protein [Planctomycetaceae bacterium]
MTKHHSVARSALAVLALIAVPAAAWAHPGHSTTGDGLTAGLMHPLAGFDHLLAMIAVGIVGAQLGGRALWAVPTMFVGTVVIGSLVGLSGPQRPVIEIGIAASVILLGVAMAWDRRGQLGLPLVLAGLFGFVHGHAHGSEMPTVDSTILYMAGFVTATAALHVVGVLIGLIGKRSLMGTSALRLSGGVIAAAGLCLMLAI